jgi:hypothetical protein
MVRVVEAVVAELEPGGGHGGTWLDKAKEKEREGWLPVRAFKG